MNELMIVAKTMMQMARIESESMDHDLIRLHDVDLRLIDEVRGRRHHVDDDNPHFTCHAATEAKDGGTNADPANRGGKCTCGRDAWVLRVLKLIASRYGVVE